jgi:hypothetical protein
MITVVPWQLLYTNYIIYKNVEIFKKKEKIRTTFFKEQYFVKHTKSFGIIGGNILILNMESSK